MTEKGRVRLEGVFIKTSCRSLYMKVFFTSIWYIFQYFEAAMNNRILNDIILATGLMTVNTFFLSETFCHQPGFVCFYFTLTLMLYLTGPPISNDSLAMWQWDQFPCVGFLEGIKFFVHCLNPLGLQDHFFIAVWFNAEKFFYGPCLSLFLRHSMYSNL